MVTIYRLFASSLMREVKYRYSLLIWHFT